MIHEGWGIAPGYVDARGNWTEVRDDTRQALVAAMSGDPTATPPDPWDVWVVRRGATEPLLGPVVVVLEDGSERRLEGHLPRDLPPGYHDLHPVRDGEVQQDEVTRLIVSPGTCHLPSDGASWGLAVQLYAARSHASWGVGDLGDLARLGTWARGRGASVVLCNPIDAPRPTEPRDPSPYFPGTRRFRDPLYVRIEDVAGAELCRDDVAALGRRGRSLNATRTIDRDAALALKQAALEAIWIRLRGAGRDDGVDPYLADVGDSARRFATYLVLSEEYGPSWRRWPERYRDAAGPDVARFGATHRERVRFHLWVQAQLDAQLAEAGRTIGLLRDLPVGFDPDGFDAWDHRDVLADGVAVGAPPDQLGPAGQDWRLPPFVPWRLRSAAFGPWIETLRSAFRHAAGLRIDHVLGLFRQFWIPPGGTPADGAYVRYPTRELLDVLALESQRAGAFVVGEDLGTVEDGVREELAERAILRYQVAWFEDGPPATWSDRAVGAVTTHDLPTLAGLWTGADAEVQRGAGVEPDGAWLSQLRDRLAGWTGLAPDAPLETVTTAVHDLLGGAPCPLVLTQLEDLLGVTERPNVPGTTSSRNWSLALPTPLEELDDVPVAQAATRALSAPRPPPL